MDKIETKFNRWWSKNIYPNMGHTKYLAKKAWIASYNEAFKDFNKLIEKTKKETFCRDNKLINAARGREACGINHDELIASATSDLEDKLKKVIEERNILLKGARALDKILSGTYTKERKIMKTDLEIAREVVIENMNLFRNLLKPAQELCHSLDKSKEHKECMCYMDNETLRAFRDLAVFCGCTNVKWWNKDLGESDPTETR